MGASFIFFLIDTFGMDRLFAFFKDIGQTANQNKSFKNIFQKDIRVMENSWLGYLNKIKVSTIQPRIIKMFPENNALEISAKTDEIYIEFNIPMRKTISIVTNCDSGVCYKNAYWKTDKILAVKVDLLPDYQYRISIGNPSGNRLTSKEGIELPVRFWSFKTGLE